MSALVLEMKGISKRFPGVVALDSVDLEVRAGEIVALAGENGAGKSTLMKILGGLHQPDSGQIRIDNQPVTVRSVAEAISRGIGFIHQELNVLDNLDVAGNVFLGREPVCGGPLKLIDRRKIHSQTKVYLQRLGLNIPSETLLRDLSVAQQQMVEIAKALSLDARILIMDEPTSSLTLTETTRLLEVIKELRMQGVSIIYISHRLAEIVDLADRVVVLRDGRNAGTLSRDEIEHDRIVGLMVGRELSSFYVHSEAERKPKFLEVRRLRTKRYPASVVSFDIGEGEILGVAGLGRRWPIGGCPGHLWCRYAARSDYAPGGSTSFYPVTSGRGSSWNLSDSGGSTPDRADPRFGHPRKHHTACIAAALVHGMD